MWVLKLLIQKECRRNWPGPQKGWLALWSFSQQGGIFFVWCGASIVTWSLGHTDESLLLLMFDDVIRNLLWLSRGSKIYARLFYKTIRATSISTVCLRFGQNGFNRWRLKEPPSLSWKLVRTKRKRTYVYTFIYEYPISKEKKVEGIKTKVLVFKFPSTFTMVLILIFQITLVSVDGLT